METIKNYLETMFMNLPNTPEVRRAKDELGQMMEDKFVELTEAGKTEISRCRSCARQSRCYFYR